MPHPIDSCQHSLGHVDSSRREGEPQLEPHNFERRERTLGILEPLPPIYVSAVTILLLSNHALPSSEAVCNLISFLIFICHSGRGALFGRQWNTHKHEHNDQTESRIQLSGSVGCPVAGSSGREQLGAELRVEDQF